jgi:hypothetical protein
LRILEGISRFFCAEDAALLAQGKDDKQKKREISPKDVNIRLCRQPLSTFGAANPIFLAISGSIWYHMEGVHWLPLADSKQKKVPKKDKKEKSAWYAMESTARNK